MSSNVPELKMFPVFIPTVRLQAVLDTMREAKSPFLLTCVPWDMLTPHEAQTYVNHGKTLEQLAAEGGLTAGRLLAVLEGRDYRPINFVEANERLCQAMTLWIEEQ